MAVGVNDLKQWAIPSNWDAARLAQLQLQSGETYDGLIDDIAAALALTNQELLNDPLIAGLIGITDTPEVEYGVGVSNGFEDHTEYSKPDAKRGATTGHMLPLLPYDRMTGWTWDFLRKARRFQIDNDIREIVTDLKNLWPQKVLTRLFNPSAVSVGSSGSSVPFADGGVADSSYVPRAMPDRGGTFLSTHDHFLRLDGITQANLETAVEHLWEHGHDGPFDLLIPHADISDWTNTTNVTGFKKRADTLIQYGAQVDLAAVAQDYLGVVETDYGACRVRANGRIPTNYWGLYKSYGVLDPRNPLWVYPSPTYGLACVLLAGDHIREFPLENAMMFMEFGVGVGRDRTAAVLVENDAAGDYAQPTIS